MAIFKSVIITNIDATPREMNPQSKEGGNLHVLQEEYVIAGSPATGDVYEMFELPVGARVVDTDLFVEGNTASTATAAVGITAAHNQTLKVDKYIVATAINADPKALRMEDVPGIYLDTGSLNAATTLRERIAITNATAAFTAGTKLRLVMTYTDVG